ITKRYLRKHPFERCLPDKLGHSRGGRVIQHLTVVELEDINVGFSAINARVLRQIVCNGEAISLAGRGNRHSVPGSEHRCLRAVPTRGFTGVDSPQHGCCYTTLPAPLTSLFHSNPSAVILVRGHPNLVPILLLAVRTRLA